MKIKTIFIHSTLSLWLTSPQAFAESSNYFKIGGNVSSASELQSKDLLVRPVRRKRWGFAIVTPVR